MGFCQMRFHVARSTDGPGPRGSTAGAALAQWHSPISFVGRWEKSAPGFSAWCCHLVKTSHCSYAALKCAFSTCVGQDEWTGNLNAQAPCMDVVTQWEVVEAVNKFGIGWINFFLPLLVINSFVWDRFVLEVCILVMKKLEVYASFLLIY